MKFSEWPFHFGAGREKAIGSKELGEAVLPYSSHVIDCFGPHRCMFESNFPVDKISCSYNTLWNSFKRLTDDFSCDERAALFHDTANRFYRLEL